MSNPDFAGPWPGQGAARAQGAGYPGRPAPGYGGRPSGGHAQPGHDGYGNGYGGDGYGGGAGHPAGGYGGGYGPQDQSRDGGQGPGWDGYPGTDGYGYGDQAGGRTAAGLRERALDRTGLRAVPDGEDLDAGGPGRPGGSGGSGPRPPRRKGSWWRRWTWKKVLAILIVSGLFVAAAGATGAYVMYARTTLPTDVSVTAQRLSSTVYFSDGKTPIGTFSSGTNRTLLSSSQIPGIVKEAVLAAEDRHFYTEGGISPTGIARAAWKDASGGGFQGGSTITQQFVRNYYASVGTQQTVSRKLKEIFIAIKLSHTKSKDWILTQYLNTIFLGDNAYGVGAAAQTYFGRPAARLNAAQSAMLAAMIQQPGAFDPHPGTAGYQPLVARWHYVLDNMVRDGAITQHQATTMKFPKLHASPQAAGWAGFRGYIMQAVENEMATRYHITNEMLGTRGLKITTTISLPMMKALYQAVNENKAQMRANGAPLPAYAHIGAVLQDPKTGNIVAFYGGPSYSLKPRACNRVKCQYNMALQARNQVGSSFKPYVLATAVKQGMNVQTSVLNGYAPLWIPPVTDPMTLSSPTKPADSAGWYNLPDPSENFGPMTTVKAAALSSNSAFADLIHRVGTQSVIRMARSLGVDVAPSSQGGSDLVDQEGQVGMALGTGSLTVAEQANTYATFANGGQYITPHLVASYTENGTVHQADVIKVQVLTKPEAASVDFALSDDTVYGTGTRAAMSDGRPIIAKTGTTNTAQSAFFIGSIPQYTLAVGIFTQNQSDHTKQTLNGLGNLGAADGDGFGGDWPALIWHTFAQKKFLPLPVEQFPNPEPFPGTKWVQVAQAPQHHKHHGPGPVRPPQPVPTPSPSPTCIPGQACSAPPTAPPTPTPTPSPTAPPTPPNPNPTPTCTFGFCGSPPPGGGGGGGGGGLPGVAAPAPPAPSPTPRPTPVA